MATPAQRNAPCCPPNHYAYGSELLARNAAELHRIELLYCGGFDYFPCGDHWHVGHSTPAIGRACKKHPAHRALLSRLAKVRPQWQRPGPVRRIGSRSSARRVTLDIEARLPAGGSRSGGGP